MAVADAASLGSYSLRRGRGSKHFVEEVKGLVDEPMPPAAPAPLLQLDLAASRHILLENGVHPPRRGGIHEPERDLVVRFEGPVVEIRRADCAPAAVDRHHLLV